MIFHLLQMSGAKGLTALSLEGVAVAGYKRSSCGQIPNFSLHAIVRPKTVASLTLVQDKVMGLYLDFFPLLIE